MKTLKIKLTFLEEMLGTSNANPELHREFIASKSADAEKIEEELSTLHVEDLEQKATTIFPKDDGKPFIYDYMIRGYFKEVCGALRKLSTSRSAKLTSYKKVIDGLVFVEPRKIFITMPEGGVIGYCQRPLRAQTAQGERISLAMSETIPAGSTIEFQVMLLDDGMEKTVKEWMDYGVLKGLGQWRNSGKGKFKYETI